MRETDGESVTQEKPELTLPLIMQATENACSMRVNSFVLI